MSSTIFIVIGLIIAIPGITLFAGGYIDYYVGMLLILSAVNSFLIGVVHISLLICACGWVIYVV